MTRHHLKQLALLVVLLLAGCAGGDATEAPAGDNAATTPAADRYTTPSGAFTLRLPDGATEAAGQDPRCGQAALCWAAGDYTLILEEADAGDAANPTTYLNLVLPALLEGSDAQLLGQSETTTAAGLPAVVLEVSTQDGQVRVLEQWTLSNGQALRLYFTGFSDNFDLSVRPLAEATFLSVETNDE